MKVTVYLKLQNCLLPEGPSELRAENAKGVPPMKIGVVILALRIPTIMSGAFNRETECAWIIKGGICDG